MREKSVLKLDVNKKAKWVAALRSGKYAKARGVLHRTKEEASESLPEGFCCLGVFAKLYPKSARRMGGEASGIELLNEESCGMSEHTQTKLAQMNDGTGQFMNNEKSFKQIAAWIVKNLRGA